jgi:hypothetical protein
MRSISLLLFVVCCLVCGGYAVAENPYNFRESEAYRKLSKGDREKLDQVHRDFMMLWGAVDRYADNHEGEIPETLDKLVPNYLAELPTDPFATSETAKENGPNYGPASKDGWGYRYQKGAASNRAWAFNSVGLRNIPYLAERDKIGLYVCKGFWSVVNPAIISMPEPEESTGVRPSPSIFTSNNRTRSQPYGASGITSTQPSLELLPADAKELIAQYERDKEPINKEAKRKIRKLTLPLIASLKKSQDNYTREAKLDEAVAIRNWVRYLQQLADNVFPNPGTLQNYHSQVGKEFYFLVTGSTDGGIWGTDVYTTDSALSVVAVHAGIIKPGETAVVKVTILPGQESYQGSVRNGVNSSSWQSFPASFKVERGEDRTEEKENEAADSPAEKRITEKTLTEIMSIQTLGRQYNHVRPGF